MKVIEEMEEIEVMEDIEINPPSLPPFVKGEKKRGI